MNDLDSSDLEFPPVPLEQAHPVRGGPYPVSLARHVPPALRQAAAGAALVLAAQGARWLLRRRSRVPREPWQEMKGPDVEWQISLTQISVHFRDTRPTDQR